MSAPHPSPLRRRDVRRRFDRAAATFDDGDFVHRHCFAGLAERAAPMRVKAPTILDLGAATGRGSRELLKRFRGARLVSLDASLPMLRAARRSRSRFARIAELQGDAARLPLSDDSFDMVWSNLLLPWQGDPAAVFREVARVLSPGGVFLFSSLGPDSLRELRDAWAGDDDPHHVHPHWDMHDLGDALMRSGLTDPVLDVDPLNVRYRSARELFRDLSAVGARNCLRARRKGLTGRRRFAQMTERLAASGAESFDISLELIYGHAWAPVGRPGGGGEVRISAAAIGRRRGP